MNLPVGTLVGGVKVGKPLLEDHEDRYVLYAAGSGRRVLLLAHNIVAGISLGANQTFDEVTQSYSALVSQSGFALDRVDRLRAPRGKGEALGFARALRLAGSIHAASSFYAEHLGIIISLAKGDAEARALLLGRYLSNGVDIAADDLLKLEKACTRLSRAELTEIAEAAGVAIKEPHETVAPKTEGRPKRALRDGDKKFLPFQLPGRPELETFFNENIIDVINDTERYRRVGIGFPGPILLHGPPGCGKTYAVEKLGAHLDWPVQQVDASSIASPYIHETSRKIAEVFNRAFDTAPSIIVIDEMDAFLSSRDVDGQSHRIEEIAEFLRRIPEAAAQQVLLIGMTNRIEAIDPAVMRRGRFDHIIEVGNATAPEVEALLVELLRGVSNTVNQVDKHARALVGRPLSDIAHVIREAGRLAIRGGVEAIGDDQLTRSISTSAPRSEERPRIGF